MTYRAVLQGYLLEEALAWLLRNTGYQLLEHKDDDPDELDMKGETLLVKGRGAVHQVDVLGEFSLTPAFSLPIRMFIEAKFNRNPCGLSIVRNAHGVIFDVNENYVRRDTPQPRRRFRYVYALFSTSGFTQQAQEYALAQQISLVDLAGESFEWLRAAIYDAAADLDRLRSQHRIRRFPVRWMRRSVRTLLGKPDAGPAALETGVLSRFRTAAIRPLWVLVAELLAREDAELLLGFPAAPFILMLGSDNPAQFVQYADRHPSHTVRLQRRGSGEDAEWMVTPWDSPGAYRLTFNLPERIESWIGDNEQYRLRRANQFKADFLSTITIYRRCADETRIYQLRYESAELHRRSSG